MQTIKTRLSVDSQQSQQFVSSSPKKVEPVRRVLVRRVLRVLRVLQLISPGAWGLASLTFRSSGATPAPTRTSST